MNLRIKVSTPRRAVCAIGMLCLLLSETATLDAQNLPAPEPGRGHARGRILCVDGPREGVPVYLHRVKPDMVAWSPTTHTDRTGRWVALNLEPGSYTAWTFSPGTMTAAYSPSEVRQVAAERIADFGTQEEGNESELGGCQFAPIPLEVVAAMLRLAKVTKADVLYNLGFDDGDMDIAAAREYGAHGVDFVLDPAALREKARQAGVSDLVRPSEQDLWNSDFSFSKATVITVTRSVNVSLRQKLLAELPPGSRIVSWGYRLGDLPPDKVMDVKGHKVLLYTVRAR